MININQDIEHIANTDPWVLAIKEHRKEDQVLDRAFFTKAGYMSLMAFLLEGDLVYGKTDLYRAAYFCKKAVDASALYNEDLNTLIEYVYSAIEVHLANPKNPLVVTTPEFMRIYNAHNLVMSLLVEFGGDVKNCEETRLLFMASGCMPWYDLVMEYAQVKREYADLETHEKCLPGLDSWSDYVNHLEYFARHNDLENV